MNLRSMWWTHWILMTLSGDVWTRSSLTSGSTNNLDYVVIYPRYFCITADAWSSSVARSLRWNVVKTQRHKNKTISPWWGFHDGLKNIINRVGNSLNTNKQLEWNFVKFHDEILINFLFKVRERLVNDIIHVDAPLLISRQVNYSIVDSLYLKPNVDRLRGWATGKSFQIFFVIW